MKFRMSINLPVFVALICSFASNCFAQSIPLLTDPIKVREVELITETLEMTDVQVESLLEVYDQYLLDFAVVRNGEVRKFEDALTEAAETFGFMKFSIPEREMIEDLISKAQRAMKAIHKVDSSFFDNVSGMFTEKQAKELLNIRIARELMGYEILVLTMLGELNRGSRAYLQELYDRIDSEPNEDITLLLETYNRKYLKEAKEGFDVIVETFTLALDMIDELGIRGLDQTALMMRFMADETAIEDLKRRGDILLKPLIEKAYEISQLNWKTWNKIDGLLEHDSAQEFQKFYFKRSFSRVMRPGNKASSYFEHALAFDGIDEVQRNQLGELQTAFNTKWKNKTENHAEVLEKSRKEKNIAQYSGELETEYDEELAKLTENGKEYASSVENRIDNILGPEIVQAMKDEKKENNYDSWSNSATYLDGSTETSTTIVTTNEKGEKVKVTETVRTKDGEVVKTETVGTPIIEEKPLQGDVTIPLSITPSFPARSAAIIGLDESGVSIIEAVYEEYLEKYEAAYGEVEEIGKAISADSELSRGARLKKSRDASKVAAEVVAELDISFFDNLAVVTGLDRENQNLLMLEHHRLRQRTLAPDNPFVWMGGGDSIDLVGLYVLSEHSEELQSSISETAKKAIYSSMQSYHTHVAELHDDLIKARYSLNHIQDAMRTMDSHEDNAQLNDSFQERWRNAYKEIRDATRAMMLANQDVMNQILDAVPEKDFWTVRTEFVKKAYPDVFKDKRDATTMIAAASAIRDLDASQQSRLEELATSFRYDYWNISEKMIENHQESATAKSGESVMNQEDMHRAIQLETLKFERKELNDRARMRLRMVLNDDQVKQVPGLRPSVAAAIKWD